MEPSELDQSCVDAIRFLVDMVEKANRSDQGSVEDAQRARLFAPGG